MSNAPEETGTWGAAGDPEAIPARGAALHAPGTTLDDVLEALDNPDPTVRIAALNHALCPPQRRRDAVVQDPDPDPRVAAVLALGTFGALPPGADSSSDEQLREAVAGLPDCPEPVRRRLATSDPSLTVRRGAIPRLMGIDPGFARAALLGQGVRDAAVILENLVLTDADLDWVKGISRPEVRALVAGRTDCPVGILEHLGLHDPAAKVRARAAANPSFPARRLGALLDDWLSGPRAAAARRPDLAPGELERAARDPSTRVRAAVLDHPRPPADVVGRLASWREPDDDIRVQALQHPTCPLAVIERACDSHKHAIRLAALSQPRVLGVDVLWSVLTRTQSQGRGEMARIRAAVLRQLHRADWADVMGLPLFTVPEDTLMEVLEGHLAAALEDPRPEVRMAVAAHPQTGPDVLTALSEDEDERVRHRVSRVILDAAG
jgi:hypothetical protein